MSEPTGPTKPSTPQGAASSSQGPAAGDPQAAPQAADPQAAPTQAAPPQAAPPQAAADAPTAAIPASTQPLPAASAAPPSAAATSGPAVSESAAAGGPVQPPTGPPAAPPGGPTWPVAGWHPGVPGGPPPPKGPGLWRQATSTTGGKIAVIVAGCLTALLVLGVVATVGLIAVRVASHGGNDRMERVQPDGRGGISPDQRKLGRLPQAPDGLGGQGNGQGNGLGDGFGNALPNGPGAGLRQLMRGAMGLGAVQHGEFTVQQNGAAVVMTLQRGEVTKASATSLTLKSADAFTATYVLSDTTRVRVGPPAVGDSVVVVAEKAGAKAVLVSATRKG